MNLHILFRSIYRIRSSFCIFLLEVLKIDHILPYCNLIWLIRTILFVCLFLMERCGVFFLKNIFFVKITFSLDLSESIIVASVNELDL
jgi:hypothetical protein